MNVSPTEKHAFCMPVSTTNCFVSSFPMKLNRGAALVYHERTAPAQRNGMHGHGPTPALSATSSPCMLKNTNTKTDESKPAYFTFTDNTLFIVTETKETITVYEIG